MTLIYYMCFEIMHMELLTHLPRANEFIIYIIDTTIFASFHVNCLFINIFVIVYCSANLYFVIKNPISMTEKNNNM